MLDKYKLWRHLLNRIIMDTKYKDAMYTGLKCGIVLAIIYLIFGLIVLWLYSTPAMELYMNTLTQPYKELYNGTLNSTSYVIGQPPAVFTLIIIVALLMLLAMAIGVLATGILAIRFGKQPEETRNETFLIGALSGHTAFAPILIVMIVVSIMMAYTGPATNLLSSMLPGISVTIPFAIVIEDLCFCLPVGGFLSGVLAGLGALSYAYYKHRIKGEIDDGYVPYRP
jgi:hypothetical protein